MTVTPPPRPHGDDPLVHAALLYRSEQQLRAAVDEFLADAVATGEPVLVIMPAEHLRLVADLLDRPDWVEVHDADRDGRNPARIIPLMLDWAAGRAAPGRVISESVWAARSYSEVSEALRHEALVNVALAGKPLSVLCPFDAEHLDGEVLAGAELTHPHLIDEAGPRPSLAFGDPLEVARGERWPQAQPEPPVAEFDFDGDLWTLRHALDEEPLLSVLEASRREDLVFAVNEIVTNAVRYGDGHARTRFWLQGGHIVGEVCADSAIIDPLVGRRTPDPEDIGGRGLWLVNQMCDLVEVRGGVRSTSVRMHVYG